MIKKFYKSVYQKRTGNELTNSELNLLWSITNGLFPFGAIIGGLLAGYSADFFGRKKSIFLVNIFVLITAALTIMSKYVESYENVMAGRFFAGMLGGSISGVVPLYLSEVSPVNLRGFAGIMNQLTIVFGVLSSNIVGKTYIFGIQY